MLDLEVFEIHVGREAATNMIEHQLHWDFEITEMMVFTQHLLIERNVWDGAMQMEERRDVILTPLGGTNFNSLLKKFSIKFSLELKNNQIDYLTF